MKKQIVVLLTLALLLSVFAGTAIVGSAATDATEITATIEEDDLGLLTAVLSSGDLTGDDLVNAVKSALAGKGTGNRYITLAVADAFVSVAQDDIFFDAAITPIREALDAFLKKLVAAGVQLDGIKTNLDIMADKDVSPSSWYLRYRHLIGTAGYANNQKIYCDIVENPLYGRYIRPLLVDRGFVFETNPSYADCEIYGIRPYVAAAVADKLKDCPAIWDSVMFYNLSRYLITAVEAPLLENYPEAKVDGLYAVKYSEYFNRDKATASAGETVKITLTKVPAGQTFYKWSVSLGSASVEFASPYSTNTTFVMPAGNVMITPIFKDAAATSGKYSVTIDGDGICDFGAGSYAPGTKVTVNCGVAPKGLMLDKWIIPSNVTLDEGCTEESTTLTFTMPEGDVHFETTFKIDTRPPVKDPSVTIIDGGDGFSGHGEYMVGAKVTINAGTREGYVFAGWKTEDKKIELVSPSSTKTTFSINETDVVLTATWKKIEEPAEGITPFYLVNWASSEGVTNVFDLPFFWSPREVPTDKLVVQYSGEYDYKKIAHMLKEHFDKRPDGTRYFNLTALQGMVHVAAEDVIYLDKGFGFVEAWLHEFLTYYKSIGGKLDGIVTDMEYFEPLNWWLNANVYKDGNGDPEIYNKIVNNPLYATEVRPLLEERGFKFMEGDTIAEIYTIYPKLSGSDNALSRSIWDAVMRNRLNNYITKYVYDTLVEYYPEGQVCDYQGRNMNAWNKEEEYDGSDMFMGGNRVMAGNNTNINFYLHRPSNAYYDTLAKPFGYNGAYYEESAYSAALWEFNVFKNLYLAADGNNISTWIAYYDYHSGEMGDETAERLMSGTAYYSEVIIHIGMLNPQPFIGFIVPGGSTDGMYAGSGEDYIRRVRVASEILEELTRVVGASDRKPITVPTTWSDGYLLSGMYAGGKNYWRITPDTTHMSLTEFRVKDAADPTFSIGGKTVTFPGGKIIEDGYVSEIGTCGYWVETATDVYPVVSYDANRYVNYPAYMEDYDKYLIATEYKYGNANPNGAWEFSFKKDSQSLIKRDPTDFYNNMLALYGGVTLKNVTIPGNITAGDNYAKQQAWEISFYLPEDLAADAEVTLLNVVKKDGIKIVGNKLTYANGDEFVELADLPLGAKYSLKRVLDFRNEEACKSDYIIYDAEGKEIAKVTDVPMSKHNVPVASISFGCANVTGDPVLVDDYKLYVLGTAADLEIYNANTGILFADQTVAHAEESAYRLSWLNASDATLKFDIMSAYYDAAGNLVAEELIKTVEMLPGADGVETGIAKKTADGQTVKIYLQETKQQEPIKPPVVDPTEPTDKPEDNNLGLIIGIAAGAVVLIVAVVVVLVVLKKKKK